MLKTIHNIAAMHTVVLQLEFLATTQEQVRCPMDLHHQWESLQVALLVQIYVAVLLAVVLLLLPAEYLVMISQ